MNLNVNLVRHYTNQIKEVRSNYLIDYYPIHVTSYKNKENDYTYYFSLRNRRFLEAHRVTLELVDNVETWNGRRNDQFLYYPPSTEVVDEFFSWCKSYIQKLHVSNN